MTNSELIQLVMRMRWAQRHWLETRSPEVLLQAKALERQVDWEIMKRELE